MNTNDYTDGLLHLAQLAPFMSHEQAARLRFKLQTCQRRRYATALAALVERIHAMPCAGETRRGPPLASLHYTVGNRRWWLIEKDAGTGSQSDMPGVAAWGSTNGRPPAAVRVDPQQLVASGAILDVAFEPAGFEHVMLCWRTAS